MTHEEITNIAKRMSKDVQKRIDKEVEERLEILREGDLSEEDMERMEDCLYMSLVLQEFLDGEYEMLEEERILLLEDMEELFNEYNELLISAKLEEKLSKKKRMALELMRIREQLFQHKDRMKMVNEQIKGNRDNKGKLEELSDKKSMKEVANKKDLPNPDKQRKFGVDRDSRAVKEKRAGGGGFAGLEKRVSDLEKDRINDKRDLKNLEGNLKNAKNDIEKYKMDMSNNINERFSSANAPRMSLDENINNQRQVFENVTSDVPKNDITKTPGYALVLDNSANNKKI